MRGATILGAMALALAVMTAAPVARAQAPEAPQATPIVIGTSYALPSAIYGGTREINVWLPPDYETSGRSYPVLYLLDGGLQQDFHHISGLTQLGTVVGTTRDVILVGVASEDRRNELAFRAQDLSLVSDYPTHGEPGRFRRFLAEETIPFVESRFRTDGDRAVIGESLAGLFVVETFLRQPELFDRYVAVSPSLWWDHGAVSAEAPTLLAAHPAGERTLLLSMADEGPTMGAAIDVLVAALDAAAPPDLDWDYHLRPGETHATTFHPAALDALRRLYPPAPDTTP